MVWGRDKRAAGSLVSGQGRRPNRYLWSPREEHPVPGLSSLILESGVYHGTRKEKLEWRGGWWREDTARRAEISIFSQISIFKKKSHSSNNMSTSLPHTATKRDGFYRHVSVLPMLPLRGHTNSWYICFPEINAIMEVCSSLSEVMSSADGAG